MCYRFLDRERHEERDALLSDENRAFDTLATVEVMQISNLYPISNRVKDDLLRSRILEAVMRFVNACVFGVPDDKSGNSCPPQPQHLLSGNLYNIIKNKCIAFKLNFNEIIQSSVSEYDKQNWAWSFKTLVEQQCGPGKFDEMMRNASIQPPAAKSGPAM